MKGKSRIALGLFVWLLMSTPTPAAVRSSIWTAGGALAHFNLGYALQQKGDKAAALGEYRILKDLDKDSADKLFDLIYY